MHRTVFQAEKLWAHPAHPSMAAANRRQRVRQPNFGRCRLLSTCVMNQIAGIVGSRVCDGRIVPIWRARQTPKDEAGRREGDCGVKMLAVSGKRSAL
jgi:hypothetical protein